MTVPKSTLILLCALLTGCVAILPEPIDALWLIALVVGCITWSNIAAANKRIDEPDAMQFALHPPAVWAQVDQALRTGKSNWPDVNISLDYSNPEPAPGQPINLQATISISHNELKQRQWRWFVETFVPPSRQDLRSRIVMRAVISRNQVGGSELKLSWQTEPIFGRHAENQIIKKLTNEIVELIRIHTPVAA